MSAILNFDLHLESRTCGECGITFAAPKEFWRIRREDGKGWYCPNGHSRVFSKSEKQKLEEALAAQKAETERIRVWFQSRLDSERRSHESTNKTLIATRGHLTRTKKRVSNGVCPCCNRTFKQLAAHMKNKHPNFTP